MCSMRSPLWTTRRWRLKVPSKLHLGARYVCLCVCLVLVCIARPCTSHDLGVAVLLQAVLHTTMGDITIKLFADECPRTVENFSVHSRNGYYNGILFHRVIKKFMIQTGDPLGASALCRGVAYVLPFPSHTRGAVACVQATALVVSPSGAASLRMSSTVTCATTDPSPCPWPTLAPAPMVSPTCG